MDIITINYKSTSCYLIPTDDGWLLVDAGWPDTLSQFLQQLNQNNVLLNEINYLVITHFHPDHAGLTQQLKDFGLRLLLHTSQAPYVGKINTFFKKKPEAKFKDITPDNIIILSSEESRSFLKGIGIEGELLPTVGHSEDSVSLVLDNGYAFTGDLPSFSLIEAYPEQAIHDSWNALLSHGVKMIYPTHEDPYVVPEQSVSTEDSGSMEEL